MTINPQIIIPIVTALTALILLMAGGRLLRPAVGLAGGLFGAGCGLLLAPSLSIDISPFIIALITGIIAAVIAVGIAKFAILLTLALGLAITTPVVSWYSVGLGDGKEVISNIIEEASTEVPVENTSQTTPIDPLEETAESALPDLSTTNAMGLAFGMLTSHAGEAMRSGIKRANAAWDVIPVGPRLMLVGAAIAGLLLGLLIATFMPHLAASIVTSSFGSVLLIEALRNGATIIWSQQDFAAISPDFLLLLYGGLALAGLGLQLTLFRRPPQEKAKA
jgi:hypothetical protein